MNFANGEIILGNFNRYIFPDNCYVISDPPYNQGYHYSSHKDTMGDKEYADMLKEAFSEFKSVVIHYPEQSINILPIIGKCEEAVSWVYNSNTGKQSRLITWWGCKPDFNKVGQPYKNPSDKRIKERIAQGKQSRLYDWWNINQVKNVSKKGNPHPCPMPLEIMKRIIVLTTKEGDTIVDPFGGSGTTALAAIETNRKFLLFEKDEIYYNYACKVVAEKEMT